MSSRSDTSSSTCPELSQVIDLSVQLRRLLNSHQVRLCKTAAGLPIYLKYELHLPSKEILERSIFVNQRQATV